MKTENLATANSETKTSPTKPRRLTGRPWPEQPPLPHEPPLPAEPPLPHEPPLPAEPPLPHEPPLPTGVLSVR